VRLRPLLVLALRRQRKEPSMTAPSQESRLSEVREYVARMKLSLEEADLTGFARDCHQIRVMLDSIIHSETARLSPPTEEEIAAYRNLFRAELDKNMSNSSASPSTDAHRVALHKFVEGRNVQR
jgi:hypothetical protein